ncbi:MAG: PKD domain-containing protein [Salibacteraceae bacterium]
MNKCLILIFCLLLSFTGFAKKKELRNTRFQFIPNHGQFHDNVKFRVDVPFGKMFLEATSFTYHFYDGSVLSKIHHHHEEMDSTNNLMQFHAYKVKFENANENPKILPSLKAPNHFNFYLGNDKSKWAKKVPAYEEITYQNLYNGIDLKLFKNDKQQLKYDLIVAPNSKPNDIKISYNGVDSVYLKNGKLYVITSLNENWEEKPQAWQIINNKKQKVNCKYHLEGNTLSYVFPNGYDENHELIIDPIMVFSSYSGSYANNFGYTATYDKYGFLYSGSTAFNPGYPVTIGAYDTTWSGGTGGGGQAGTDMAITKWDTTGTFLIYSTYLGGSSDESPHSLVVSEYSELFVMGTTGSIDFPTTPNGFDTSFNFNTPLIPVSVPGTGVTYINGADITVTRFDSSGSSLLGSTFLGGTHTDGINNGANKYNYADEFRGEIEIDKKGKVYVVSCTRSNDNPVTATGFQTSKISPSTIDMDGIVYKLSQDLSTLEWTNYLGGISADAAYSIAIDQNNDIYISGGTYSFNFPTTPLAFDTSYNGVNDAFVTKISEDGNTMQYSTFYGSVNYDQSYFVELDYQDYPHIYGQTSAPRGELVTNAIYNDSSGGQLITKLSPQLDSVVWSTRFGTGSGTPDISPTAFLVDVCSAVYLSGWGQTNGLDTAGNPYQGTTDGKDFYLMVMSADASSLEYATYIGGAGTGGDHVDGGTSRFDRKGKIYQAVCAGCGNFDDFPTEPNPGAWSNTNNTTYYQGCNLAVFKMDFLLPIVIAEFDAPSTGCAPLTIDFTNLSKQQSQTTFFWDFGDGSSSTQFEPTHTYSFPGVYTVKLFVSDAATCNISDSSSMEITIINNTTTIIPSAVACNGEGVQIGIPESNDPYISINWSPTSYLSDSTISNPIASPVINTTYTLILDNGICADTLVQLVEVDSISVSISGQSTVCLQDAPFLLQSTTYGTGISYLWSNFNDFSDTIPSNPGGQSVWVTPSDSVNTYYLQVISDKGCIGIDSFQITVRDLQDPIIASFMDPGLACAPALINFTNTSDSLTSTTYLWDFGNGNQSTNSNPSTTYINKGIYTVTLIATDSSICPQSDTFALDVTIKADSNYSVSTLACYDQPTEIGIPADTISGITYSWTPSTGLSDSTIHNPTVTSTSNATYLLVVNHVCTDSVINTVTVTPISAATDSLFIICSDNPTFTQMGNSNGTGVEFVWSTNSSLTDTLNTSLNDSSFTTTQTSTFKYYYFNVTSAQGCQEIDSLQVVISDQTVSISSDTFICQDDTIQLSAQNSFPVNEMDFYWTPTSAIIGANDTSKITVAPLINTYYYLSAINDSGCIYSDSILVEVSKINNQTVIATADDDSVIVGFQTILRAEPNTDYNYTWTPANNLETPNEANTAASPTETTTYTVNITDPENANCSYSNEVTVHTYEINCGEPDIFIPNAFSPNGDEENDVYQITGKVVEEIDLKIYNRWGELVFETTDPQEGWDGTFNGTDVDPVVFVYNLSVTCIDRREFTKKGNITVIR